MLDEQAAQEFEAFIVAALNGLARKYREAMDRLETTLPRQLVGRGEAAIAEILRERFEAMRRELGQQTLEVEIPDPKVNE